MNRQLRLGPDLAFVIDGPAGIIHETPEAGFSYRNRDRLAGIDNRKAPSQSFGRAQNDCAGRIAPHMLHDFKDDRRAWFSFAAFFHGKCVINRRDLIRRKFYVNDLTKI